MGLPKPLPLEYDLCYNMLFMVLHICLERGHFIVSFVGLRLIFFSPPKLLGVG